MSKTEPWHYCKLYNIATLGHQITFISYMYPDSKVHGPSWGPSEADRTKVGPIFFVIWVITQAEKYIILLVVCIEHRMTCCCMLCKSSEGCVNRNGYYGWIQFCLKMMDYHTVKCPRTHEEIITISYHGLQENMHQCIWEKIQWLIGGSIPFSHWSNHPKLYFNNWLCNYTNEQISKCNIIIPHYNFFQ